MADYLDQEQIANDDVLVYNAILADVQKIRDTINSLKNNIVQIESSETFNVSASQEKRDYVDMVKAKAILVDLW